MAYFQLDKNPKRKLENEDDYDKYADACYRQATHFSYLCINNMPMVFTEHCMAWFTNAAFACELFFKYHLFCLRVDYKKYKKEHNLYNLFKLLPDYLQEDIIKCHPDNMTKELFELQLYELGKAFIEFRYSYEKDMLAFCGNFLIELFIELTERTQPFEKTQLV